MQSWAGEWRGKLPATTAAMVLDMMSHAARFRTGTRERKRLEQQCFVLLGSEGFTNLLAPKSILTGQTSTAGVLRAR